mmetsp:Transcript_5230/g.13007  ORF Transcript_5230/g.13007 Transcript_5230/m.13007 type:complete len:214 (+) Transcript_5230:1784-2425(+)
MQRDLRISFLLQVTDNNVSTQFAVLYPHLHVVELTLLERQLEQVLGAIEPLLVHGVLAVYPVKVLPVGAHDVNGVSQRMDDSAVTVREAILHVAQGAVHQDAVLVPRSALDTDVLVEGVEILEVLPCKQDVVLGHKRDVLAARGPNDVADAAGNADVSDHFSGGDVIQHHLLLAFQEQSVVPARVDVLDGVGGGRIDFLRQLVLKVVNADRAV